MELWSIRSSTRDLRVGGPRQHGWVCASVGEQLAFFTSKKFQILDAPASLVTVPCWRSPLCGSRPGTGAGMTSRMQPPEDGREVNLLRPTAKGIRRAVRITNENL